MTFHLKDKDVSSFLFIKHLAPPLPVYNIVQCIVGNSVCQEQDKEGGSTTLTV